MPRGVRIAEPRQHLFAAAERVIAAAGPSGLTSRAVTREAGVATGLLFTHFMNFDDFLVGYAVDRSFQIAGVAAHVEVLNVARPSRLHSSFNLLPYFTVLLPHNVPLAVFCEKRRASDLKSLKFESHLPCAFE